MKKLLFLLVFSLVIGCSGSLSEKDRKALREEMENREIRQVRDQDIVNGALEMGRAIRRSDSLLTRRDVVVEIYENKPLDPTLKELWEAYEAAIADGTPAKDNIQRAYPENLIYTDVDPTADGGFTMIVITIPKSVVIQSL